MATTNNSTAESKLSELRRPPTLPLPVAGVNALFIDGPVAKPPHWVKAAEALQSSHFDEVRGMVRQFLETESVVLRGSSLTVGQVTAITQRASVAVELDEADVKSLVSRNFEMTDMKELHYFLGIEVIRTLAGIMISQRHYIDEIENRE